MEQKQSIHGKEMEQQAVALFTQGDMVACFGMMIYRLAYARLQSRHDADDIFQEVFLRYVRRAPDFASYEHGKAWFLRTTINCCKNFWMSAWQRKTTSWTEELQEQTAFVYDTEESQSLAAALAELPVKYRTVLHLYYYEGLSSEEISRLQHKPAGTIRMQLSRGRDLLKVKLEGGQDYAEPISKHE